ncbi:hypothetical protein D1O33_00485 [Rhodococcus rhodochrous]|nr:hypothetical protein D1O33_00485 [Rhodococcus rhodochrous]
MALTRMLEDGASLDDISAAMTAHSVEQRKAVTPAKYSTPTTKWAAGKEAAQRRFGHAEVTESGGAPAGAAYPRMGRQ